MVCSAVQIAAGGAVIRDFVSALYVECQISHKSCSCNEYSAKCIITGKHSQCYIVGCEFRRQVVVLFLQLSLSSYVVRKLVQVTPACITLTDNM